MKHRSKTGSGTWLSYHIFLPGLFDLFLVDHLLPALEAVLKTRLVKRFFFIRYSEGGHHVRLRLRPATAGVAFEPRLTELVHHFAIETLHDPSCCRVEQHRYDRSELYFGETALSVYSELLNQQTSYFSLRLLRAEYQDRQRLMVVLASTMNFLLLRSANTFQDFALALEDSRCFAANMAAKLGFPVQAGAEKFEATLRSAILNLVPQTEAVLGQDLTIQRIIRLLRRTRRCNLSGNFVTTHALHLLCNKLGISIVEEYHLFRALSHFAVDTFCANKKAADHERMA